MSEAGPAATNAAKVSPLNAASRAAPSAWMAACVVLAKELRDALRDRATLMTVLIGSVLSGPLIIFAMSFVFKDVVEAVESRTVHAVGMAHAPTLHNFLKRRGVRVVDVEADVDPHGKDRGSAYDSTPPEDTRWRALLTRPDSELSHILMVPPAFEDDLLLRRQPELLIYHRDDKRKSSAVVSSVRGELEAFNRERSLLELAWMAVPATALEPVRVEARALTMESSLSRPLAMIMPILIVLAAAAAGMSAALDSTAGERERGSLEPLMMNPASAWAMALGKWGAVAALGLAAAVLTCLGFMPMPYLVGSERLGDLLAFRPSQAGLAMLAAAPIAAVFPAVLMALAIHCKTVKQAQSMASFVVIALSMGQLPLQLSGSALSWQIWVPGVAQMALIGRVFSDQPVSLREWLIPVGTAALMTAVCLALVARGLRQQAVK